MEDTPCLNEVMNNLRALLKLIRIEKLFAILQLLAIAATAVL